MSWAEEDWTVGLSGNVLRKVKELQVHHERLSRENKQKQLLLDNIQASLEKQTTKYEKVRVELQCSHRELQRVQEEAQTALTSKERLSQDLQSKQAQVCSLEGQLDAARTLNNKLTQEVKRLEAELEKLQNSSSTAETTLFSTPYWSSTSPWESSGSKKEERHGNKEDGKTPGLHVRRLQFSDMPSGSLPRQQPRGAHQTPDVYSTPSAAFPWERDDNGTRRPSPESPKTPQSDAHSQSLVQDLPVTRNSLNDSEAHAAASELRSRLADLAEELRVKSQTLNTVQNEVAQNKKELAAKQLNLQKLRDELSLAHTRMAQEGERASAAEQKAKQLQEELKCQRQNAESSRVQHQQRTKDLEKQHQRDLQEFQKERQFMERQHQQEINKVNQELAQARALHNALQAQLDKTSLQKQALEKEVDSLKEKLKWTEGQLQQSQKQEAQTQAKLTESVREAEGLTVSLKQSQKKERVLEEEGRRLTEERDHALCLLKEVQEQKAAAAPLPQTPLVCSPAQSSSQNSFSSSPQTRKRSPAKSVRQKRDEVDRRGEITAPYPTDREPGEGIDSEQISDNLPLNSEYARSQGSKTQSTRAEVSETETTPPRGSSDDVRAENAALHSELRDVRDELQRRLDDLEAQRRAETEARTRLKQLSRKSAAQANEKEEQYKECKAQLEKEKAEVEKLKKAVAALEAEMARERLDKSEGRESEEENDNVAQDKEDEMIELNMQLKKQLSEVKAQLVLEQEERKQLEEKMTKEAISDVNLKAKIEELEAKLEQFNVNPSKSTETEASPSAANSPVTYLTLREDEINSNVVDASEQPETFSLCESINEHNAKRSLDSGLLIHTEDTALIDHSLLKFDKEENGNKLCGNEQDDGKLSALTAQVQSLQKENVFEKERASQSQVKLELLQNQVTQQTQQLTMAFERQSQHISGLLAELQEKENTIHSAAKELEQCKQELKELKGHVEMKEREEKGDNHDREESNSDCIKTSETDNNEGVVQSIPDQPVTLSSTSDSAIQGKGDHRVTVETSEISTELKNLQWENLLLKLKISALTSLEPPGVGAESGGDFSLIEQIPKAQSDSHVQAHSTGDVGEHGEEREEQPEAGSQRPDEISHLQQQVAALQTKLQALSEENRQKAQELALWRLSSESVTSDPRHTAQEGSGGVTLLREDEILLSCNSNKLHGRTLSSRLLYKAAPEPKTPPPSTLNEDHSESDKENTSPARLNQRNDIRDAVATRVSIKKSVGTQTETLSVLPGQRGLTLSHPELRQQEEEPEEELDSPSLSPVPLREGQLKDSLMLTASFPIPADPASLAERIRRNRTQLSAAFDDTEYEPYGLPEVVMKGFADIPTGPSCPYIVRRGLLGTAALPVPQKNPADSEETD